MHVLVGIVGIRSGGQSSRDYLGKYSNKKKYKGFHEWLHGEKTSQGGIPDFESKENSDELDELYENYLDSIGEAPPSDEQSSK